MTHPMIEKAARAAGEARNSFGYRIQLTGLVDGVSTYELRYEDTEEVLTFPSYEGASDHVGMRKGHAVVLAVLQALRDPTLDMVEAGRFPAEDDGPLACWQAIIDSITGEG